MRVIRPEGIHRTPFQIARDLGCKTWFYPNPAKPRVFDYERDFFMCRVSPEHVQNAPPEYSVLDSILRRDKYHQRVALDDLDLPTPGQAGTHAGAELLPGERFVVRPLRHTRGMGFRVTENRVDFQPGVEYISCLYRKQREYRVIFVFGKPLIWLRKKPNEQTQYDQPWGHENAFFQTILDVPGSRLAGTDFIERVSRATPLLTAHILAFDILYSSKQPQKYVILEVNACPSLSIDTNRKLVTDEIKGRQ